MADEVQSERAGSLWRMPLTTCVSDLPLRRDLGHLVRRSLMLIIQSFFAILSGIFVFLSLSDALRKGSVLINIFFSIGSNRQKNQ